MDLRERVLADCDEGRGATAVAAKYRVSESWVRRLKQRRKATGETAPRPSGRRPCTWAEHAEAIRAAVAEAPDATLRELKERLGLAMSLATLCRAVTALGLTVNKSRAGRRAGPPRRPARLVRRGQDHPALGPGQQTEVANPKRALGAHPMHQV
jgi:transposase